MKPCRRRVVILPLLPQLGRGTLLLLLSGGLCLQLPIPADAQTLTTQWYVSPDGNDANAGTSWAAAKATVQDAVNAAADGDTVLVTNGVYALTGAINIAKAITLASVNGSTATILDGQQAGRCVTINGVAATVDGFTLRNGRAATGGGVYCNGGTIRNCVLTGNQAVGNDFNAGLGGGGYVANGSLSNCVAHANSATSTNTYGTAQGGGVYCHGSLMVSCLVSNNQCTADYADGGGVFLVGGELRQSQVAGNSVVALNYASGGGVYATIMELSIPSFIEACVVGSNTVTTTDTYAYTAALASGGGLYIGNGTTVRSTLVVGNTARAYAGFTSGGGVRTSGSSLENCTIVHNDVATYYGHLGAGGGWDPIVLNDLGAGGGVMWGYNDQCYNNIIMFNSANNDPDNGDVNSLSYPTFIHSDIGPWFGVFAPEITTVDCISADPLFVNAAIGDFRLQPDSPCRNAGTNLVWMAGMTDLAGNSRIGGGVVDMGALEFGGVVIAPRLSITEAGTNVVLTWPADGVGFTLQSTPDLSEPAIWTEVTPVPIVMDGQNTATNPIAGSRRFYRLWQ